MTERSLGAGLRPLAATAAVAAVLLAVVVIARGDSGTGPAPSASESLAHVHGLGVNPANGDLYAASHFGLFRLRSEGKAERAGKLVQDTMGFTVVGPDHFVASGHPDINDKRLRKPGRPPLLGLIERRDGGRTHWEPGEALPGEPQALLVAGDQLYAAASSGGATAIYVSSDGARSWRLRYADDEA